MPSKKNLFLPFFIIALMVFSTFGVIIGSFSNNNVQNDEIVVYNGYEFTFDGTSWYTFKDKERIESFFKPDLLNAIDITSLYNKLFNHEKIYLTVEPDIGLGEETQFFKSLLGSITGHSVVIACPQEDTTCTNLPLKDCPDAVPDEILVIKLLNGSNMIQEEQSCVAVLGDSQYIRIIIEKIRLEYLLHGQ